MTRLDVEKPFSTVDSALTRVGNPGCLKWRQQAKQCRHQLSALAVGGCDFSARADREPGTGSQRSPSSSRLCQSILSQRQERNEDSFATPAQKISSFFCPPGRPYWIPSTSFLSPHTFCPHFPSSLSSFPFDTVLPCSLGCPRTHHVSTMCATTSSFARLLDSLPICHPLVNSVLIDQSFIMCLATPDWISWT